MNNQETPTEKMKRRYDVSVKKSIVDAVIVAGLFGLSRTEFARSQPLIEQFTEILAYVFGAVGAKNIITACLYDLRLYLRENRITDD